MCHVAGPQPQGVRPLPLPSRPCKEEAEHGVQHAVCKGEAEYAVVRPLPLPSGSLAVPPLENSGGGGPDGSGLEPDGSDIGYYIQFVTCAHTNT